MVICNLINCIIKGAVIDILSVFNTTIASIGVGVEDEELTLSLIFFTTGFRSRDIK